MILPPQETERFYRIWFALLRFTNEQRHLVPKLPAQPGKASLSPSVTNTIRQAVWADDPLRERFIAENPASLSQADLEIVATWRYRIAGDFFVLRHLKKYTIFLKQGTPDRAYGVLGLVSPLEDIVGPYLPVYIQTVLLPFRDHIIYDGLLAMDNMIFGSGIRRSLNMAYRDAQEREGIITSLLPSLEPASADEARKSIRARNANILTAFRKALYRSGLSPKMVEQHVGNMESFANTFLLDQDPPRPVLQIEAEDLQAYLARSIVGSAEEKTQVTSFTRFVRFLYDSGRLAPETVGDLQNFLKLHRRHGGTR